jgi:hypothetical protein
MSKWILEPFRYSLVDFAGIYWISYFWPSSSPCSSVTSSLYNKSLPFSSIFSLFSSSTTSSSPTSSSPPLDSSTLGFSINSYSSKSPF